MRSAPVRPTSAAARAAGQLPSTSGVAVSKQNQPGLPTPPAGARALPRPSPGSGKVSGISAARGPWPARHSAQARSRNSSSAGSCTALTGPRPCSRGATTGCPAAVRVAGHHRHRLHGPAMYRNARWAAVAAHLANRAVAPVRYGLAMPDSLSIRQARRLALAAQGLSGTRARRPASAASLRAALGRVGAVQIDSVNVVARSHELTLAARAGAHDPAAFDRLLYRRRAGFEQWGHAASFLPVESFRWFLPRMHAVRVESGKWFLKARSRHPEWYPRVLERIRAE